LQEANEHYGAGFPEDKVRLQDLVSRLKKIKIPAPDLEELEKIENDPSSFFSLAAMLRHKATHQSGNPLMFFLGGGTTGVRYKDPRVPQVDPQEPVPLKETVRETSEHLLGQLASLIVRLRALR
jgi:hypothetical protein